MFCHRQTVHRCVSHSLLASDSDGYGDPPVGIIRLYPASISPHPAWLTVYVLLIYLFQVGYCLLLVLTKNPDTKVTRTP